MKKFIKYAIRIILGILTLFFGVLTCLSFIPDDYPCGTPQAMAITMSSFCTIISLIMLWLAWYLTKKW